MKACTKCKDIKPLSNFYKRKDTKDGRVSWCKDCKNKDRLRYKRAANYQQHGREYYYRNKEKWRGIKARRRARLLQASPALDSEYLWMINEIYELASLREKCTGVKWEVDHTIPLQGKDVCGLHIPWNLQVITQTENRRKGITWADLTFPPINLYNYPRRIK